MDPNLVKIKEANLEDIKRGRFSTAMKHAEDYLLHVLDGNWVAASKELSEFKVTIVKERK